MNCRRSVWAGGMMVAVCVLAMIFSLPAPAADEPAEVRRTSEDTVEMDANTQKAVDEWAQEEERLLQEIDRLEAQLRRVAWEREKTADYRATLEQKVRELKEKAAEMEKVNDQLLPVLDQGMERLNRVAEADFPFDRDARLQPIRDARRVLNDYDASLLAKTRALLDAVSAEVNIGYSVDTQETEVPLEGRTSRVKLLRVGRVGLFALTMDGRQAFVWDAVQEQFSPAPGSAAAVRKAVEIVERIRIVELTRLPVGRPEGQMQFVKGGAHE